MRLSKQQRKILQEALIDAFPNTASLEQMLSFQLNQNLRAIAGEGSLQEIVFKLIQAAESQGWVEELVRAARDSNPGNKNLQIIAQELLMGSTVISPTQQQKNRRGLVVPIFVAVIGVISTITVWINKPQLPPTTPPSPSPSNKPSSTTSDNQPPPVATPIFKTPETSPSKASSQTSRTAIPTVSEPLNSTVNPVPDTWPYFKNCPFKNANTYHVIVDSSPDYNEADEKIKSLQSKFPQIGFKLFSTVGDDGVSNRQYALIVGHGLNKTEANALVRQVERAGVTKDAYPQLQPWNSACKDWSSVKQP